MSGRRDRRARAALLTALLALSQTATPQAGAQQSGPLDPNNVTRDAQGSIPGAGQSTSQKLQQLQQQLQQQQQLSAEQKQQLETLRARVASLGQQQQQALTRISALEDSIAGLENKRQQTDALIRAVRARIAALDLDIQGTQARVARLQEDVRQLLNTLYRQRSGSYLQLISQATSLSDLLIRVRYANYAGTRNVEVVQQLRTENTRLQTQRAAQAAQAAQLGALQAQQVGQLRQLQAQRTEQNTLAAQLRRSQAGQQALAVQTQADQALTAQGISNIVGGIVQERSRLEAERLQRIEAERQRRLAELARIKAAQEAARREQERLAQERLEQERQARAAQALRDRAARQRALFQQAAQEQAQQSRRAQLQQEQSSLQVRSQQLESQQQQAQTELSPLPSSVGALGFPLPGGRVSQPFNTTGPWTVISGSPGEQAVAVAEGNVITSAYYATTGWVVILDHGPILSAYFGLAQTSVQVGDRVGRGAPVGTVGGSPQFGAQSMALQIIQVSGGGRRYVAPGF